MVLDTATLRIAFGLMALVLVLLFYFSAYRTTRSPYSGWWCLALLFFLAGSACFLLDGTPHQVWANPLGNALLVQGGVAVWAGARSLRTVPLNKWAFTAIPLVTLAASALDNPATNTWSGGPVFLAAMSLTIGLASRELWRLEPGYSRGSPWPLLPAGSPPSTSCAGWCSCWKARTAPFLSLSLVPLSPHW
jgi:hypothetical protein